MQLVEEVAMKSGVLGLSEINKLFRGRWSSFWIRIYAFALRGIATVVFLALLEDFPELLEC